MMSNLTLINFVLYAPGLRDEVTCRPLLRYIMKEMIMGALKQNPLTKLSELIRGLYERLFGFKLYILWGCRRARTVFKRLRPGLAGAAWPPRGSA